MGISAAAVFAAGLLTFLSPCVLPLIPVYLSILSGGPDAEGGRFRGVLASLAFAAGFTLVFSVLGLSATVLGRALIEPAYCSSRSAGSWSCCWACASWGT